jgi:hypothetical protein
MKKKGRFTEEQTIAFLKQHEAGRNGPELAREVGVSEQRSTPGGRRLARHNDERAWNMETGRRPRPR